MRTIKQMAITSHNIAGYTGVTVLQCRAFCEYEPKCKSFEYNTAAKVCHTQHTAGPDAGASFKKYANYDYYDYIIGEFNRNIE